MTKDEVVQRLGNLNRPYGSLVEVGELLIPTLSEVIEEYPDRLGSQAIQVLAAIGGERAEQVIASFARHESLPVRLGVTLALETISVRAADELAQRLANDPNESIVYRALRVAGSRDLPSLGALAEHLQSSRRSEALRRESRRYMNLPAPEGSATPIHD